MTIFISYVCIVCIFTTFTKDRKINPEIKNPNVTTLIFPLLCQQHQLYIIVCVWNKVTLSFNLDWLITTLLIFHINSPSTDSQSFSLCLYIALPMCSTIQQLYMGRGRSWGTRGLGTEGGSEQLRSCSCECEWRLRVLNTKRETRPSNTCKVKLDGSEEFGPKFLITRNQGESWTIGKNNRRTI